MSEPPNYADVAENMVVEKFSTSFPKGTLSRDDAILRVDAMGRECNLQLPVSLLLSGLKVDKHKENWVFSTSPEKRLQVPRAKVSCLQNLKKMEKYERGFKVTPCRDLSRFECVANRFEDEFGSLEEQGGFLSHSAKRSTRKGVNVSHINFLSGLFSDREAEGKPAGVQFFEKESALYEKNTMEQVGKLPKVLLDPKFEEIILTIRKNRYLTGIALRKKQAVNPKLIWRFVRAFCKKGEMADCENVDVWIRSGKAEFPAILAHPKGFSVVITPAEGKSADRIDLSPTDIKRILKDPAAAKRWQESQESVE